MTHWKVKYEGEITVWSEATSRRGPEHIQGSVSWLGPQYWQGSASGLGPECRLGPEYWQGSASDITSRDSITAGTRVPAGIRERPGIPLPAGTRVTCGSLSLTILPARCRYSDPDPNPTDLASSSTRIHES